MAQNSLFTALLHTVEPLRLFFCFLFVCLFTNTLHSVLCLDVFCFKKRYMFCIPCGCVLFTDMLPIVHSLGCVFCHALCIPWVVSFVTHYAFPGLCVLSRCIMCIPWIIFCHATHCAFPGLRVLSRYILCIPWIVRFVTLHDA